MRKRKKRSPSTHNTTGSTQQASRPACGTQRQSPLDDFLLGAAQIYDFFGVIGRPPHRSDWEWMCKDGEAVAGDFQKVIHKSIGEPELPT